VKFGRFLGIKIAPNAQTQKSNGHTASIRSGVTGLRFCESCVTMRNGYLISSGNL
jgi:hypothetical protein